MVAKEVVLPVDVDTAWELVNDERWLGEDAPSERVVEESSPGERLVWWWEDGRVEVVLEPLVSGTRITVTETATGPLCLA